MHGLYLLWWVQERHVSPAAVAVVLAAGDFALTALEVPTGWLADRYGHRVSLIVGSALQVAGMLWCWLGRGIPGILTANLLVACGDAFRSGADQALLYRSCLALDREADFQLIAARTRAATLTALVLLVVTGGVIVHRWSYAAGWILESILSGLGLCVACAMTDPPPASNVSRVGARSDATSPAPLSRPRSTAVATLAAAIAPASCLGGMATAFAFFAQTSGWADVDRATTLVAVVTLAEAAGAVLAQRAPDDMRTRLVLAGLGIALPTTVLLDPTALIPATVGLSFLVGAAEPLRATAIQRLAADNARARAASIANACDKVVATAALIVAGWLQPRR